MGSRKALFDKWRDAAAAYIVITQADLLSFRGYKSKSSVMIRKDFDNH